MSSQDSDDESSVYSAIAEEEKAMAENDSDGGEEFVYESDDEPSSYESEENDNSDFGDDDPEIEFDEADTSDEEDLRNTIGNIPVEWYNEHTHIGYDWSGEKISKPPRRTEIEEFLKKMEDPDYWRTVRDKQTGREIRLSDEDIAAIRNIQQQRHPVVGYNPYQPYIDYFSGIVMKHPISEDRQGKASFIPSKSESIMVGKMVHAMKMGWIKPQKEETDTDKEPNYYDLWKDYKRSETRSSLARYRMHIPAPKMILPGHAESYNPPPEYLLTPEEREKLEKKAEDDDVKPFIPEKYGSLRQVPSYSNYVKERFERCLDLYLAPRQRRIKSNIDPEDLLPKLPKPEELQPFPTTCALIYKGHEGLVRTLCVEPTGQFIATASDDLTLRLWEVHSGRCLRKITTEAPVDSIAWCPNSKLTLVAVACGTKVYIVNAGVGDKVIVDDTDSMLSTLASSSTDAFQESENSAVQWSVCKGKSYVEGYRLCISHKKPVKQVVWHGKGDYFATVMPEGGNSAVVISQLSKLQSQVPFKKRKGLIQRVMFHPLRPHIFVATQRHVRVYNLAKQQLTKKLECNCKWVSSMAIHPKGDNFIIGGYDNKVNWFDLDLSSKPYKTLRFQTKAVRSVCFHRHYPLFASASDDGTVVISHGMVYGDLLQNALIVPVKILRGHEVRNNLGVLDCCFHPTQPWIFTCGADNTVRLYA